MLPFPDDCRSALDFAAQLNLKLQRSCFLSQWRYQLTIDGTVAAYRVPYLLAGDSVVLKQDSPYYEHFYHDLRPWVHYIPFKRDLSDLGKRLEWAMNNQNEVNMSGDTMLNVMFVQFKHYFLQPVTMTDSHCSCIFIVHEIHGIWLKS